MAKFIELHILDGTPLLINLDHVAAVLPNDPDEGGSIVYTTERRDNIYNVKEEYDKLRMLLKS